MIVRRLGSGFSGVELFNSNSDISVRGTTCMYRFSIKITVSIVQRQERRMSPSRSPLVRVSLFSVTQEDH